MVRPAAASKGPDGAEEADVRALADADLAARRATLRRLAGSAGLSPALALAVPVLLRDEVAEIRCEALTCAPALAASATAGPAVAGAMLAAGLGDGDRDVRAVAAALLHRHKALQPEAIAALPRLGRDAFERSMVAWSAVPDASQALGAALQHDDARVRHRSIATLQALGDPAIIAAAGPIRAALRDEDGDVSLCARACAARLLRVGAPQLADAKPMPVSGFDATTLDAKATAAAAKAPPDQLRALAADGRAQVRRNAWRAIAAAGVMDHATTLLATVALKDEDADARALAAAALERPAPELADRVVEALIRGRMDAFPGVRAAVVRALEVNAALVVEAIAPLLDARDDRLQRAVVETLVELGTKRAVPVVRRALTHIAAVSRTTALMSLPLLGAEAATACFGEIVEALRDPWDAARAAAVEALVAAPRKVDDALVLRLREMYRDDGAWMVRQAADRALQRLAPRASA